MIILIQPIGNRFGRGSLKALVVSRHAPGRVMLLRGMGNAINPPLATEFIRACMEVIPRHTHPAD